VSFFQGSWFEAVKQAGGASRFDLIVSNPPYIAEGDAHLAALRFEPRLALTAGPDGLDAIREIIRVAPEHLVPGGWLLLEHGHDQAEAVRVLLREAGFAEPETRRDFGGNERVSGGRLVEGTSI
jgi:release factor glutamine methyltransferase